MMAGNDKLQQEYVVGYGRPPRNTQFKPGQSGNPKGRPKGRANFRSMLERRLYQTTKVRVDGDVRNITVLEAAVMRLAQALVQAPTDKVINIMRFVLPLLSSETHVRSEQDLSRLTDDELEQLIILTEKLQAP
jgi:hypothetical protein